LLLVFGRFNTKDIDTRIWFKRSGSEQWQGGLTAYSLTTVQRAMEANGHSCRWERFVPPIALEPSSDPIRTFTVETKTGEKLVLNGANVVAEHHFLLVRRSEAA
jgi:hypothetical protein